MANYVVMMILYAKGETEGQFENQKIKDFHFWLLIELLVNTSTFINAIAYLLCRAFLKDTIILELDDNDRTEDFMGGDIRVVQLNVFAQGCMPFTVTSILKFGFLNQNHAWGLSTSEESITFLTFQWYLQLVQTVCCLYCQIIGLRWRVFKRCQTYFSGVMLYTFMLIVPILSLGLCLFKYQLVITD